VQRRQGSRAASAGLLIVLGIAVTCVAAIAGLGFGSHPVPPATVVEALLHYDVTNNDHVVVREARIPRVLLGLVVGVALGLAGAVMQSFTRNPLADPGLLGVNAGAAMAVVLGIAYLGVTDAAGYVWFAFAGAALGAVVVHLLGSTRQRTASPARLVLAGAAVSMVIGSVTGMILISFEATFSQFRYWTVGTLQGRDIGILLTVLPFVVAGTLLAFSLIRPLNSVALGEDTARALGTNITAVRTGSALAVVLLAGAATAAAGPIAFIGLAAPHLVRVVVGPDLRLLIPGVLVVAPALLLTADVLGRVAVAPGELQTGIAVAAIGAPVFIALVRSYKVSSV